MEPVKSKLNIFFSKVSRPQLIIICGILGTVLMSATGSLLVHIGNEGSRIKNKVEEIQITNAATHKELEMFENEQTRTNNITREQYQRIEDKLDKLIELNLNNHEKNNR
jgi:hypothetical protein